MIPLSIGSLVLSQIIPICAHLVPPVAPTIAHITPPSSNSDPSGVYFLVIVTFTKAISASTCHPVIYIYHEI
jgi:hypothetical protein